VIKRPRAVNGYKLAKNGISVTDSAFSLSTASNGSIERGAMSLRRLGLFLQSGSFSVFK